MPPPKKTAASRSAEAGSREVAPNPYATPDPGPEEAQGFVRDETFTRVGATTPVTKFVVPPVAPVPVLRAHGHVLTERGWVREEGNHG